MNIDNAVTKSLCAQCGVCVALCPKGNIEVSRRSDMDFQYHVKDGRVCGGCEVCSGVCPAAEADFAALSRTHKDCCNDSSLLGRYDSIFIGRAQDVALRQRSASAGAASAMAGFLLNEGAVKSFVSAAPSDNVYEPRYYIARKPRELRSGTGSMYYPVPVDETLSDALKEEGPMAFLGLPCHILALKKAESHVTAIKDGKIKLKLGLFCGWNTSFGILGFIAGRSGIADIKNVRSILFRQGEWPGNIMVELKTGAGVRQPGVLRDYGSYFYMLKRCMLCPDQSNELADISFGDAWGTDGDKRDAGFHSLIISRSKSATGLLREAARLKFIELKAISEKEAVSSQARPLLFKKRGMKARMRISEVFDIPVPKYTSGVTSEKNLEPGILEHAGALMLMAITSLLRNNKMSRRAVNTLLPMPIIKAYAYVMRNLVMKDG